MGIWTNTCEQAAFWCRAWQQRPTLPAVQWNTSALPPGGGGAGGALAGPAAASAWLLLFVLLSPSSMVASMARGAQLSELAEPWA